MVTLRGRESVRNLFPVVLGLVVIAALSVAAQQRGTPPPQGPPQFRSTTDVVLVDVSVLDKNRRPVKGLVQGDFTLLEDGETQQIANFTAVDLPDADVPSAKWMTRAPLDVQTNSMPDGRLVLIYLDERQMNATPFATKSAMDTAHAIIDGLSPKDVAAVGFVLDHRGAQEFTTDRARLHAAVDSYSASAYVPISFLGTMNQLSQLLSAIPERRKIVFYIGAGANYDPEVITQLDKVTTSVNMNVDPFRRAEQQNLFDAVMGFIRIANRANVSIYTVDPNGLDGSNLQSGPREFLRLVSNSTGARAVVGNNSPQSEVPKILAENASYYLLAYRPSNTSFTGKYRRIEVRVNRPGLEIRTRRGYVEGRAGPVNVAGMNPALGRLIPATQLSLGLWAVPASADPTGSHPVAMLVDVELPRAGARPNEHLAIGFSVVDMSGKERASGKQDLTVSPPTGEAEAYVATVPVTAALPPGRYDIRLSAQLVERNMRGGLLGDVVVPDFAKDGLSTTGVFIGPLTPGVAARADVSGQPLARFLSVTPTTDREFSTASSMIAAMRVYQAKQPPAAVTVKATVLDAKDKAIFESVEKLDVPAFAAGFADYRLPMPFAKIGPGVYLLRLEASRSGAPAVKREVRFAVK